MSSEWSDPSDVPIEISTTQIKIGEPLPSTFYPSREALLEAYQSHALGKGYAIVLADSAGINRPNQIGRRVVYKCDRWGKYITKRRRRYTQASDAMLSLERLGASLQLRLKSIYLMVVGKALFSTNTIITAPPKRLPPTPHTVVDSIRKLALLALHKSETA
jgi:hypothetical protein